MPTYLELVKNGTVADIVSAGGIFRECFCGPCFGAGDTPANGEFSIRHTTRNFPNREGSKPGEGQISAVALMDARSIAATAANGGYLTAASELTDVEYTTPDYHFDQGVYDKRVYNGWGYPEPDYELKFGPNIKDWPEQPALSDDLLVKIVSYITDPVTTTDELIPSGETSSFRSNPLRLAEFTLSRKDPAYVPNAKAVKALDEQRKAGELPAEVARVYDDLKKLGYAPRTQPTPTLARPSLPISPATAPHVSRRLAASACWAAPPTLPASTPQALPLQLHQLGHVAVPAGHPVRWTTAITSTCPACARPCWRLPIPCPPWLLSPMAV